MNAIPPRPQELDAAGSASVRRIVIIGFMGAGKSTVGSVLAGSIGWDFVDLDDEVERREGIPVHEIIRERGIADFRRLESTVGRELLQRQGTVISVGGGWPAEPGHMDTLGNGTASIWLRVGTETALERIAGSGTARPLLQVDDSVRTAESLLRERIPHYRRGNIVVDTEDRAPEEVVIEILKHIRPSTEPSWPGVRATRAATEARRSEVASRRMSVTGRVARKGKEDE